MKTVLFSSLIFGMISTLTAHAQSGGLYTLNWSTPDSGGNSAGAKFQLSSTVGQPDGGAGASGAYTLQGGFTPGFIKTAGPPLTRTPSGALTVFSWPNVCTGFVLEGSPTVANPVWTPLAAGTVVGANRQVSLLVSGTSFFRLRKDCPANCAGNCPD